MAQSQAYVKKIILENFGSYTQETIIQLLPGLNVITGPNGSGKTLILESFMFVSNQNPRIGRSWRNSISFGKKYCTVTLEIQSSSNKTYQIERTVFKNRRKSAVYSVNGKRSSLSEVKRVLNKLQIPYDNPLLLIKANTLSPLINQLKGKSQHAIRDAIEESTGLVSIVDRYKTTKESLKDKKIQLRALDEEMATISHKIQVLTEEKRKLDKKRRLDEQRDTIEEQLNIIQYLELKTAIQPTTEKLEELKTKQQTLQEKRELQQEQRTVLEAKERDLISEITFKKTTVEQIEKDLAETAKQIVQFTAELEELQQYYPQYEFTDIEQLKKETKIKLKKDQAELKKLQTIQDKFAEIQTIKTELQRLQTDYDAVKEKKIKLEDIPTELHTVLQDIVIMGENHFFNEFEEKDFFLKILHQMIQHVEHEEVIDKDINKTAQTILAEFFEFATELHAKYREKLRHAKNTVNSTQKKINALKAKNPKAVYPPPIGQIIDVMESYGEPITLPVGSYLSDLNEDVEDFIRHYFTTSELFAFFISRIETFNRITEVIEEFNNFKDTSSFYPLLILYNLETQASSTKPSTNKIKDEIRGQIDSLDSNISSKLSHVRSNLRNIVPKLPHPVDQWIISRLNKIKLMESSNNRETWISKNNSEASKQTVTYYMDKGVSVDTQSNNANLENKYINIQYHTKSTMLFSLASTTKVIKELQEIVVENEEIILENKQIINILENTIVLKHTLPSKLEIYQVKLPNYHNFKEKLQELAKKIENKQQSIDKLEKQYERLKRLEENVKELTTKTRDFERFEKIKQKLGIFLQKEEMDKESLDVHRDKVEQLQQELDEVEHTLQLLRKQENQHTQDLIMILKDIDRYERELASTSEQLSELEANLPASYEFGETHLNEVEYTKDDLETDLARIENEIAQIYIRHYDAEEQLTRIMGQKGKTQQFIQELKHEINELLEEARHFEQVWQQRIRALIPQIKQETNEILEKLDHQYRVDLMFKNFNTKKSATQTPIEDALLKISILGHFTDRTINDQPSIDPMVLSEGQKSLIIIALIFGMQRAAGSGIIYLMDEFDQNLDAVNSNIVWEIARTLSDDTQYLILTPNPKTDNIRGVDMLITVAKPRHSSSQILLYPKGENL